jgi:hypothetical protein
MRRSTKVFAFVVAAVLTTSACGGSDNESAPSDPAGTDAAPVDTTEDDRDRNVQVGGWGIDGQGVAEAGVRDRIWTNITTRVFRRSRIERVNNTNSISTRDVFVATFVGRSFNEELTGSFVIAGFDTTGDDPTTYPMKNFGTNGVVTLELAAGTSTRDPLPIAWTVLSRDLMAVYYSNSSEEPRDRGVVEYYDLSTGKLMTTLGDNGRTTIPLAIPIDEITDFGLRRVDPDGTLRLVVAGIAEPDKESARVVVVGFTPDGTFDPFVGDEGAGVLDFGGSTGANDEFRLSMVNLVDQGVDGKAGVGVIIRSTDVRPKEEQDWSAESELLTFIFAGTNTATGVVSVGGSGSFVAVTPDFQSYVQVQNATISARGEIVAHVIGTPPGTYPWQVGGYTHQKLTASSAGVSTQSLTSPSWEKGVVGHEEEIVNVSAEGKNFVVKSFNNEQKGRYELRACFGSPPCVDGKTTVVIPLIDRATLEDYWPSVASLAVDEKGVHVAVRYRSPQQSPVSLFKTISFDTNGVSKGNLSALLDPAFETRELTSVIENGVERWTVKRFVTGPVILDSENFAAIRSNVGTTSLLVQRVGAEASNRDMSLPLGLTGYASSPNKFVPLSSHHIGIVAYKSDRGRYQTYIYKVDTDNGTVDTSFGDGGGVVFSQRSPTNKICYSDSYLLSTAGTVTMVEQELNEANVINAQDCDRNPIRIHWQTFGPTGRQVGTGLHTADLSLLPGDAVSGFAADGLGNVFVAKDTYGFDEAGDYEGSTTKIAKFTPDGRLDATFGQSGVIDLADTPNLNEFVLAADSQSRLYLARIRYGNDLMVHRFTAAGTPDVGVSVTPTTTASPTPVGANDVPPPNAPSPREERARLEFDAQQQDELLAALPADDGLTVTGPDPVITSVKPIEDRSLTVTWALSAAVGNTYVTATANPGGRACTSDTGSCIIRGLDPSQIYTVTVALKGATAAAGASSLAATPVVSMKVGRVASPTTFVRPASRGAATWKVRGGCTLNANNTRITAPRRATKCQLAVTTAKFGSTPKTTKSVTIVVRK